MPAVSIDLPHVVDILATLPESVCAIPSIALAAGLFLIVMAPNRFRALWWLVAGCLSVLFVLDQHRLQPWAYQSAIYALVFAAIEPQQARRLLVPLAASVYLYSGAGKFDYQFMHTVGQQFLETIFGPLGGLPDQWERSDRARWALIFPALELLCGIGLLIRPARVFAGVGVMIMHATLILALGPWSLDHSNGVLIWNLLLIVQAYVLFIKPEWMNRSMDKVHHRQATASSPCRRVLPVVVGGVVVVALVAPLSERFGYWDHWTSWALYSPHTSRVDIELHRSGMDALPPSLLAFVEEDHNDDGWRKLAVERWSLSSRGVPVYPQARYQLALAERIATQLGFDDEIRVRMRGVADRWTGRRDEKLLLGRSELRQGLAADYWINKPTRP